MSDPIIQVRHLTKVFGEGESAVHALDDISLDVHPGEIYGIIGLSGAGKSTLVRCLNLLERPTSGSVLVDGKEMTKLSDKELRLARRNVTMIFQSFNAIARALATDPKVLLCDEATSALDPTTTASILSLLKDLNQKLGVTVVVITHQMSVIEEICTKVAILDGGSIAEEGEVTDIFSNPKTDAARRLVYPGGVSENLLSSSSRTIRVAFNGGTAYQPLIASLAIDCGVKVNILGADTRNIDGKAFGSMLLGLPEDENEAAKALSYIRSQPYVTAEEVDHHG